MLKYHTEYREMGQAYYEQQYRESFVKGLKKRAQALGFELLAVPQQKQSLGEVIWERAIAVARQFGGRKRNFNGERFWARGYAVSTVGFEEEKIKEYIRNQEQLDVQGSGEIGGF